MEIINKEDVLNLYKHKIYGLRVIENHNIFPLHYSEILAGVVGDLMGDGHLQGYPKWRIDYTSASLDELKRFEKVIFSIFKVKGKARPCTTNKFGKTFNYGVNCKFVARILNNLGVPSGSKVLKKFEIPKWILNNKVYFRGFVRRLFDCEGNVDINKNGRCIDFRMYKEESILENGILFIEQIRYYLKKYFDIGPTNIFKISVSNRRKDGKTTYQIRFKIKNKKSLLNFYKEIDFENIKKKNRLSSLVRNI